MRRWREGIERIPPLQLQKSKVQGMFGNVVSMIALIIICIVFKLYIFILLFGFNLAVQVVQFLEEYQKLLGMRKMNYQLENLNEFLEVE